MDDIRKYKHKVLLVTRVSLHGLIIVHFPDHKLFTKEVHENIK